MSLYVPAVRNFLDAVNVARDATKLAGLCRLGVQHLASYNGPKISTGLDLLTQATESAETLQPVIDEINRSEAFADRMAPVIVHHLLSRGGQELKDLVGTSHHPRFQVADLDGALRGYGDEQQIAILAAANQQSVDWERIEGEQALIPMEAGALVHSGGDFDAVAMLLVQQGLSYRLASQPGAPTTPLFAACLTRPDNGLAMKYTAGIHKRGLPLHQFLPPFRTTAFPLVDHESLTGRFELHFLTPTADRMKEAFTPEIAALLPPGAFIVYAPKSFKDNYDMDEWTAHILCRAGRPDVATAFIAGYTSARAVFALDLPELAKGQRGLHLGIGTTDLEKGLRLAALLTGTSDLGSKTPSSPLEAPPVHVFQNFNLVRPSRIEVYDHAELRRAQRLYGVYKNVYSGINGRDLFYDIWKELEGSQGDITSSIIDRVTTCYGKLMETAQGEIRRILIDVEGIPEDQVVVLALSLSDGKESWTVREVGRLIQMVKGVFFDPIGNDGRVNQALLGVNLQVWKQAIEGTHAPGTPIFSTRNTAAGIAIAASVEATRYRLTSDPRALLPKDVTYEGLNTAVHLDQRLSPEQLRKLPERVIDYIKDARGLRQPQVIPPVVRRGLANLASFLQKRASGQMPNIKEVESFLHRRVSQEEVDDRMRWEATLTLDDFVQAATALRNHIENAGRLIQAHGNQHARLSADYTKYLEPFLGGIDALIEETSKADSEKSLQPRQILMLMHALKSMITEGDRIYVGESFTTVMKDLQTRMVWMFAFILGKENSPYPTGFKPGILASRAVSRALKRPKNTSSEEP